MKRIIQSCKNVFQEVTLAWKQHVLKATFLKGDGKIIYQIKTKRKPSANASRLRPFPPSQENLTWY